MKGSTCRWILWSTRRDGSKPYSWSAGFTSHAMRHFWSLASNLVIGPAPLFDAMMFFQLVSTSAPRGVTSPRPVTTTRRISVTPNATGPDPFGLSLSKPCNCYNALGQKGSPSTSSGRAGSCRSALVLVDILDRVANRRNLLGGVIRIIDKKLLFERHD